MTIETDKIIFHTLPAFNYYSKDNKTDMNISNNRLSEIAFLFDLDGVLVDSESQYTIFWDSIGKEYGIQDSDFAINIKGTTLKDIFNRYFPDIDDQRNIEERLNKFEADMPYNLKPGVSELLFSLKEKGIPAVMVTSSNDIKMSRLWKRQPHLRNMFTSIVTADSVTRSKPDPQGYLLGASIAGVNSRNCAVFEDSAQGVEAGFRAGAYVVGIAGTLPAERLEHHSDILVDTLEDFDIDSLISVLLSR